MDQGTVYVDIDVSNKQRKYNISLANEKSIEFWSIALEVEVRVSGEGSAGGRRLGTALLFLITVPHASPTYLPPPLHKPTLPIAYKLQWHSRIFGIFFQDNLHLKLCTYLKQNVKDLINNSKLFNKILILKENKKGVSIFF